MCSLLFWIFAMRGDRYNVSLVRVFIINSCFIYLYNTHIYCIFIVQKGTYYLLGIHNIYTYCHSILFICLLYIYLYIDQNLCHNNIIHIKVSKCLCVNLFPYNYNISTIQWGVINWHTYFNEIVVIKYVWHTTALCFISYTYYYSLCI